MNPQTFLRPLVISFIDLLISVESQISVAAHLKETISARWVNLLTETQRENEEARKLLENVEVKKKPIRETLDIKIGNLVESIQW